MSRLAHSLYQDAGNGEKSDIPGARSSSDTWLLERVTLNSAPPMAGVPQRISESLDIRAGPENVASCNDRLP